MNLGILKTVLDIIKKWDFKVVSIIILLLGCCFICWKYYDVVNEYNNLQIENSNRIARADSLKHINEQTQHKLIEILSENDIKKEEIRLLNDKIKGDVITLNSLKFQISSLQDSIKSMELVEVVEDSTNTGFKSYMYSELFNAKDYNLIASTAIYSATEPRNVSLRYKLDFKDIGVIISTRKEDDYRYSILVKADSDIIKLKEATGFINIPKPKVLDIEEIKPTLETFWNRWNIGIYAGADLTNKNAYGGGEITFDYKGTYALGYTHTTDDEGAISIYYERMLFNR